jgi:hypothetical protein
MEDATWPCWRIRPAVGAPSPLVSETAASNGTISVMTFEAEHAFDVMRVTSSRMARLGYFTVIPGMKYCKTRRQGDGSYRFPATLQLLPSSSDQPVMFFINCPAGGFAGSCSHPDRALLPWAYTPSSPNAMIGAWQSPPVCSTATLLGSPISAHGLGLGSCDASHP